MELSTAQLARMMANTAARERRRIAEYVAEQAAVAYGNGHNDVGDSLTLLGREVKANAHGGTPPAALPPAEPEPETERVDLSHEVPDELPPMRIVSDEDDIAGMVGSLRPRAGGGLDRD